MNRVKVSTKWKVFWLVAVTLLISPFLLWRAYLFTFPGLTTDPRWGAVCAYEVDFEQYREILLGTRRPSMREPDQEIIDTIGGFFTYYTPDRYPPEARASLTALGDEILRSLEEPTATPPSSPKVIRALDELISIVEKTCPIVSQVPPF